MVNFFFFFSHKIVFVSSRRQTRLTAQDLISFCGMEDNPRQFLSIDEFELEDLLAQIRDINLRFSLQFGIGLHHAGLVDQDRKIVEKLFVQRKIQVLTSLYSFFIFLLETKI